MNIVNSVRFITPSVQIVPCHNSQRQLNKVVDQGKSTGQSFYNPVLENTWIGQRISPFQVQKQVRKAHPVRSHPTFSPNSSTEAPPSGSLVRSWLHEGGVGTIILDRPKALNAADISMVESVRKALRDFADNPNCKAVVVESSNPRAFCSGGDVKAISSAIQTDSQSGNESVLRDPTITLGAEALAAEYNLICEIANFRKPFVSLMLGVTMGFGLGIAGHGKYRVVTESSLVAMPETVIGLLPDVAFSQLAARAPGSLGMYMALTGARIRDPVDLMYMGLGTHFVTSSKIETLKDDILKADFSSADPYEMIRLVLADHAEDAPHIVGSHPLIGLQQHIDHCFANKKSVAAIVDALKMDAASDPHPERHPAWEPMKVLDSLMSGSPTALCATHAHYTAVAAAHRSHNPMPIEKILRDEHRICVRMIYDTPDFCEGVRAALVDKDRQPKWSPEYISDVQNTENLFEKLADSLEIFYVGDTHLNM